MATIGYPIGQKLVAHYHGTRYLAEVAAGEHEDDDLVVVVTDPGKEKKSLKGKPFASLSGAGRALTGAKAVGGRSFWTAYEGEPPAAPERKAGARPTIAPRATTSAPAARTGEKQDAAAEPAEKPTRIRATRQEPTELRIIKPARSQADLDANQVRYTCHACQHTFVAENAAPEECPSCGRPAVLPPGSDMPAAKVAVSA